MCIFHILYILCSKYRIYNRMVCLPKFPANNSMVFLFEFVPFLLLWFLIRLNLPVLKARFSLKKYLRILNLCAWFYYHVNILILREFELSNSKLYFHQKFCDILYFLLFSFQCRHHRQIPLRCLMFLNCRRKKLLYSR